MAALSLGVGHVFVPDVSSELGFDEIVLRDGPSIVGALAITVGCRFWVSPNGYATLGFGRATPQNVGLTGFDDGGYAFAGGVGYAMAVTAGTKLTVGVGVTHIADRDAATTVSALLGVLAL